ncbi:hypothetical protein H2198_002803 [Neophaeococcomyces mojaviensis]|uniref:Uncharacterized protein n=1 Tax=Neophaeococcomyces mojaviensis TaxID=3383035 RepID=A0ACC3AE57_9EURO|nr:hypothetical protein H2198_002803 [Knufia sp. JES_112]
MTHDITKDTEIASKPNIGYNYWDTNLNLNIAIVKGLVKPHGRRKDGSYDAPVGLMLAIKNNLTQENHASSNLETIINAVGGTFIATARLHVYLCHQILPLRTHSSTNIDIRTATTTVTSHRTALKRTNHLDHVAILFLKVQEHQFAITITSPTNRNPNA